jgi:hypothetical protein
MHVKQCYYALPTGHDHTAVCYCCCSLLLLLLLLLRVLLVLSLLLLLLLLLILCTAANGLAEQLCSVTAQQADRHYHVPLELQSCAAC